MRTITKVAFGLGAVAALSTAAVAAWALRPIETPAYSVEAQDGDFELRRYPALVVASVLRGGSRRSAVSAGFGPLANYIFAKSRGGEKIAMTAPVTQARAGEKIAMTAPVVQGRTEAGWVVSFIMPAGRTLDDLPEPAGDVHLAEEPPRRMAVVRFSGAWTDANFASASDRLLTWVAARGLTAKGPVEYAYYNDPFTPAFLRRNEAMVEVAG